MTEDQTEPAATTRRTDETDMTEDFLVDLGEEFDLAAATNGRYVYRSEIRTGGMGRVIEAYDTRLERPVAVKILRTSHLDKPELTSRFICEARITANLVHPGVVPVFDIGCDNRGRHFFVMQKVEGKTLADLIADTYKTADVSPQRVSHLVTVVLRACETIAYAHHRGIVHRDLKPANIMVGQFGEVLVMDWGLAKCYCHRPDLPASIATRKGALDEPLDEGSGIDEPVCPDHTRTGKVTGTPRYMSPEQASGGLNAAGPTSDVFSLGIILYEVLTGLKPFDGESIGAILAAVRHARFTPLRQAARQAGRRAPPRELAAICHKALALHPHDRYPSAREMAADLEAYFEHRAVSAYREPFLYSVRRWMRRYPVFMTIILAGLVVAAAGAGMGAFRYYERRQMMRPFILQASLGERLYRDLQAQIDWLQVQLLRIPPDSERARDIERRLRELRRKRVLVADQILFAKQRIFSVDPDRPPEEFREFRRLWLNTLNEAVDIGEEDFAAQRYLQMELERPRFPWWRWQPDEFPRVAYLRGRLRAAGYPLAPTLGTAPRLEKPASDENTPPPSAQRGGSDDAGKSF